MKQADEGHRAKLQPALSSQNITTHYGSKIEIVRGAITALKMTFTVTYHSSFMGQRTWKETQHFTSKLYGMYTQAYSTKLLT